MSISGRAGVVIGGAGVLVLGVAGTAACAAVEASSHPTAAPSQAAVSQAAVQQHFEIQPVNDNRNSRGDVRGTAPPPWTWPWWNHRHFWHRWHRVAAVPLVVGEDSATAISDLRNAGFHVVATRAVDPSGRATAGNVFRESPRSGTRLRSGATVTIDVAEVAVPNVVGEDRATATSDLRTAGFRVVAKTAVDPSGQATPGNVFSQSPGRGTMVTMPGVTVTIVVAKQQPSSPPTTPPSNPTTPPSNPTTPPSNPTTPPAS